MRSPIPLFLLVFLGGACASSNLNEVDIAKADLAEHLQLPLAQISVISITEKTWNNSSLGCPRPDMAHRDVRIDGSQLILSASKRHYYYHAGSSGEYFFCANPENRSIKKGPIGGPNKPTNPEF